MDTPALNPSPESLWYYADAANQPVGPLTMDVLQRLAGVGVISPETHVLEMGGTEWKKFVSVVLPPVRTKTQLAHAETTHTSTDASAKENTKGTGEASPPVRAKSVPPLSRNEGNPITAKGFGETINVLKDKIQISRNFFAAIGKEKLTEIPLSAIRAIHWKAPGLFAQGHIQFFLEGATQAACGSYIAKDRHAVTFNSAELRAFQALRREVEQKLGFPISEETPAASERADKAVPKEGKASSANRVFAAGGGLVGVPLGILLLIIGVGFCFTLVGALIGIPMIVCALRLMGISVKGMAWGANPDAFFEGNCPHCGYEKLKSSEYADNPGINCPACAKRIVIRDKRFIKVD